MATGKKLLPAVLFVSRKGDLSPQRSVLERHCSRYGVAVYFEVQDISGRQRAVERAGIAMPGAIAGAHVDFLTVHYLVSREDDAVVRLRTARDAVHGIFVVAGARFDHADRLAAPGAEWLAGGSS